MTDTFHNVAANILASPSTRDDDARFFIVFAIAPAIASSNADHKVRAVNLVVRCGNNNCKDRPGRRHKPDFPAFYPFD